MQVEGSEREILLLCARGTLAQEQIDRIKQLCAARVDWEKIYTLATQHRILPLVYRNSRTHCANLVPSETLEKGKLACKNNGMQNLMMVGHLIRILSLLHENNIAAVPFKGPVLALSLYGDPALRSFGDIDVLIHRKNLNRAVRLLVQQGFLSLFSLNKKQLEKLSRTDNEFPLINRENGVTLDLQWEISGGYFKHPMTLDDLSSPFKDVTVAGKSIPGFSDEDLLLYLCIHGNQHTWRQLDHVCCIAELIRITPDIDWEKIFLTATRYKALRMLKIALLLIEDLFGLTPPVPFASQLKKDAQAVVLARQISAELFSVCDSSSSFSSHRFMKYHFLSMDNPLLAIRYALRLFFMPTRFDWQLYPLPASLSFLHYIIRPVRLGFTAGKKALMHR
ncbi:MAG: nucleotidyltransferase family protein [Desulfocapsa sp.]|uniref:Nucleotidyltransferase family protein n=1 Tax=Desulfotalea psychrophila TaxID=84980 RepID=A0ABS3AVC1_9BACT|nr:nucleotidyltransferase family protein [Desulfocapsa sp.]MBN4068475.1 nucleotidyltransferase family protein [Desulfotalea psychrophila]